MKKTQRQCKHKVIAYKKTNERRRKRRRREDAEVQKLCIQ